MQGLIIDSIVESSDNFCEEDLRQIVLQPFLNELSLPTKKTAANVAIAARRTLQSVDINAELSPGAQNSSIC